MTRLLFSITLLTLPAISMFAVKAWPGTIDYRQPDGSIIKVRIVGGRTHHYLMSAEGYPLMALPSGECRYAMLDKDGYPVPSDMMISPIPTRKADEHAFLRNYNPANTIKAFERIVREKVDDITAYNNISASDTKGRIGLCDSPLTAMGEKHTLVILCNYSDTKFSIENPKEFFSDMLNKEGFSEYGATGSVRDFFISNSGGKFAPVFDVYGPVDLPNKRFYYGRNNYYGNEPYAHEMVIDAAKILDDEIDFSRYDTDGDGIVDNVFIIYAGYGEADTARSANVWPHSYELIKAEPENRYIHDGVTLNHYACTNELAGNYDRPAGIGTFVHEFSHVLGLPDLYTTVYNEAFTPGEWSTMDSGPYNNEGRTPPYYSSFERYALGWLDPKPLDTGYIPIEPLPDSNCAYMVTGDSPNEFFLFENRQQQGYDSFLPGHGLLIWHIDFDSDIWEKNTVNNDPDHQRVDLIEADRDLYPETRDTDAFPTVYGYDKFTPLSDPAFLTWDGNPTSFALTLISEKGNLIEVTVERNESQVKTLTGDATGRWYRLEGRTLSTICNATLYDTQGHRLSYGDGFILPEAGIYMLKASTGEIAKIYCK